MRPEEILQGIEVIAEEHLGHPGELQPEMDLVADLELDSLLLLTLAVEVENRFEIVLREEDEAAIRTVGELVDAVGRRLAEEGR